MKENYPKCRTCRHLDTDGDDAICRRIDGANVNEAWLWGSDHDADSLLVHPDLFGCILHEEKEAEG